MNGPLHVVCPHCSRTNRVPADKFSAAPTCGACKQSLFTGAPVEVDAAGLKAQVARSDIPVLVDFWAPWCAPCRMMAPAFAEAAARFEPRLRLLKLNTEDHPQGCRALWHPWHPHPDPLSPGPGGGPHLRRPGRVQPDRLDPATAVARHRMI